MFTQDDINKALEMQQKYSSLLAIAKLLLNRCGGTVDIQLEDLMGSRAFILKLDVDETGTAGTIRMEPDPDYTPPPAQ